MIIPISLQLRNFLSFEDEIIEFKQGVTTCIMGNNLTQENQKSNGSGKSAFQTGFEYALIGLSSRKVKDVELIRIGQDQANIVLKVLDNINNETITIERSLFTKKSSTVTLTSDKRKDSDLVQASVDEYNKWIERFIGVARSDISNYYIPNESNYISFFNMSDTKQKELISRFSNAEIVNPVFDKIQKKIDEKQLEIDEANRTFTKFEGRIEDAEADILKLDEVDFEEEKKKKLYNINEEIEAKQETKKACEADLKVLNTQKSFLNDNIIPKRKATLNTSETRLKEYIESSEKFEESYKGIEEKSTKLTAHELTLKKTENGINEDISDVKKDIQTQEIVLDGKIECPSCKFEFNPKAEISIEEAKKNIEKYKQELVDFQNEFNDLNILKDKLKTDEQSIRNDRGEIEKREKEFTKQKRRYEKIINLIQNSIDRFENEAKRCELNITSKNDTIKSIDNKIEDLKENLKQVKASKEDDTKRKELEEKIKTTKQLKEDQLKVIQNLVSEKETISEWTIRFKGFKSFLANKKLKIIQNMINKYLKDMKCSDQLKLEGYRMVGKETREKITPSIYRDGELRSFGSFSKGERVRIDMATLMTLQTLVNESSKTGGLGILFADEIGEGLDSMGVGLLLESLNLTRKTTMYTTHVVDDKIYDNILMIEKRNNISQIKRN